jgi:hypothetical protein
MRKDQPSGLEKKEGLLIGSKECIRKKQIRSEEIG